MNRRNFFASLAGLAATAAAVDPERLLWTPGRKLISLPTYARRGVVEILDPSGSVADRAFITGRHFVSIEFAISQRAYIAAGVRIIAPGESDVTHTLFLPKHVAIGNSVLVSRNLWLRH